MRPYAMLCVAASMGVGCSTEPETITARQIASSIEVGKNVDQTAPYGLPVYPGARVEVRILSGLGMLIEANSTVGEIADFYSQEVEKLGYEFVKSTKKGAKISISGVSTEDPEWRLNVSVQPREDSDSQFILIFAKVGTS